MNFDIQGMLYSLPAVLAGLTIHEFFHAFVAFKLGDDTAKAQGRISLNPLKHIDPFGMLLILIAGFGWAKPVRFNPEKLKHPRRDRALIALAGPFSNLLLAFVFILILKSIFALSGTTQGDINPIVLNLFVYFISINLGLFIFNILPLPPLDGSHVVFQGLKIKPETETKIYRYGMYVLLAVILIGNTAGIELIPVGSFIRFIFNLFF